MTIHITERTIGIWFCDTVAHEQNFMGHLERTEDNTGFTFEYRFKYTKTGNKNWYTWTMKTDSPDAVLARLDMFFGLLPRIGLTPDGPVYAVLRAPGTTLEEFAQELFSQPWWKVVGVHPPGPTTPQ